MHRMRVNVLIPGRMDEVNLTSTDDSPRELHKAIINSENMLCPHDRGQGVE